MFDSRVRLSVTVAGELNQVIGNEMHQGTAWAWSCRCYAVCLWACRQMQVPPIWILLARDYVLLAHS